MLVIGEIVVVVAAAFASAASITYSDPIENWVVGPMLPLGLTMTMMITSLMELLLLLTLVLH